MSKGFLSFNKYLKKIKTLTDTLAAISTLVDEDDDVLYALNGLPTTYNAFKMVVRARVQFITLTKLHNFFL